MLRPRSDDLVPSLVGSAVEAGRPPTVATAPLTVGLLILRLRDGVLDLASTQVAAVPARAVRLSATRVVRSRARVTASWARDPNTIHNVDQRWRVTPLSGSDHHSQRTAASLTRQMNPRRETTPWPAERLFKAMLGRTAPAPQHPGHAVMSPGGMLMGAAHRRIHAHHTPVDSPLDVGVRLDRP